MSPRPSLHSDQATGDAHPIRFVLVWTVLLLHSHSPGSSCSQDIFCCWPGSMAMLKDSCPCQSQRSQPVPRSGLSQRTFPSNHRSFEQQTTKLNLHCRASLPQTLSHRHEWNKCMTVSQTGRWPLPKVARMEGLALLQHPLTSARYMSWPQLI